MQELDEWVLVLEGVGFGAGIKGLMVGAGT